MVGAELAQFLQLAKVGGYSSLSVVNRLGSVYLNLGRFYPFVFIHSGRHSERYYASHSNCQLYLVQCIGITVQSFVL